jgi:diphosphomevalonate decarboxylase
MASTFVKSSPSLALIKYWGKQQVGENIPATSSLAITLKHLVTLTKITSNSTQDHVTIDNASDDSEKMKRYLVFLKSRLQINGTFSIESKNSFPKASGLASSASGYAALATGFAALSKKEVSRQHVSALAQAGSGSAARSIFGGFTVMRAGKDHAEALYDSEYWPELRIIICMVTKKEKEQSSGAAMNAVRESSVFYKSWLDSSEKTFNQGIDALKHRDLEALGGAMQLSYKRMFGTMLGANPPILYWLPQSVELMRLCSSLRRQGIGAWETMDAGPQVKILCQNSQLPVILAQVNSLLGRDQIIITEPGNGAGLIDESEYRMNGE